jgi:hypothetical protein
VFSTNADFSCLGVESHISLAVRMFVLFVLFNVKCMLWFGVGLGMGKKNEYNVLELTGVFLFVCRGWLTVKLILALRR